MKKLLLHIHGAHAVFRLGKPSFKKENLFLYVILDSSYTSFFTFIGACFFNQCSCLRYFNANFSPANLTAYVANVNPALTSHVLDDIKICFLKVRRADANLHAYVADASEIFCTIITKAVQAWEN